MPAGDQFAGIGYSGSPHAQADDVEVGGQRGREALDRLRNASGGLRRRGARERRRGVSRSFGGDYSSRSWNRLSLSLATRSSRVLRAVPDQSPRVSCRVPGSRLRETDQGRISDSPRDLRPAVHGLVNAGEIPANAGRVAADGGGDPQPMGEGRQNPLILPANISSTTLGSSSS